MIGHVGKLTCLAQAGDLWRVFCTKSSPTVTTTISMGARKTTLKKLLLISIVGIFIAPQIAFAVWWNPFTWKFFQRTPTTPPQAQIATTTDPSAEIARLQKKVVELERVSTTTTHKTRASLATTKNIDPTLPSQKTSSASITDAQALGKQLANGLMTLTDLDNRIESLEKILAEARASESRYADYAEASAGIRTQSLETLSSGVENPNTKQFIVGIAESERKNAVGVRASYHKLYSPIYEAIVLWNDKILMARGDVNQGVPPSNLSEILTKDNFEQERFILLIQHANKIVYDLELKKTEGSTKDLGYIRNLLLLEETTASVNLQLGAIEQKSNSAKIPSTEIHCWATTQYSGSLLNGKSETSIRCE